MRNLKKVLSLVLALAMVLSICMVGAGAVNYDDFTDEESITKKQAVETLVSLDVIKGYNDGATFNPTGNVTRAEMATMICRILAGGDNMIVDATKPVPTYTDIRENPSAAWAESYIEYCTSLGIVSGKGNGLFDPMAPVTAAEAAKMVMTTLGYNADIEGFKGIGWDINTMAKANTLQLLDNLQGEISASVPVTREQVAQLLYNALDDAIVQNYVGNSANTWISSGATAYQQTLLESKFHAVKITGVVEANEWADLYGADPIKKGTTRLALMDNDGDLNGETQVFNVSTSLLDIGKSVIVFWNNQTKRVLYGDTQDTGTNVVSEIKTGYESIDKGDNAVTGSLSRDNTQYFINYNDGTEGVSRSDYRIGWYASVEETDVVTPEQLAAYIAGITGAGTDVEKAEAKKEAEVKAYVEAGQGAARDYDTIVAAEFTANADGNYVVSYEIRRYIAPGADFTTADDYYIRQIFRSADRLDALDGSSASIYFGEVYVGTQSNTDISDSMSYNGFVEKYLEDGETGTYERSDLVNRDPKGKRENDNGNYIRAVDFNNDGEIDYVMQIRFNLGVVTDVDRKGDVTISDLAIDRQTRNPGDDYAGSFVCDDEVAADDVVIYTIIDGKAYGQLAESFDAEVKSYSWRNDEITTVDGDVYGQSMIKHSDIGSTFYADLYYTDLEDADDKVNYTFYQDLFGYVAAFIEVESTNGLMLLTDGYYSYGLNKKDVYQIEYWNSEDKSFDTAKVNTSGSKSTNPWTDTTVDIEDFIYTDWNQTNNNDHKSEGWERLIGAVDCSGEHVSTILDNGTKSWTNLAALKVADDTATVKYVDAKSNRSETAIAELKWDEGKGINATTDGFAAKSRLLTAINPNNGATFTVMANSRTVYYYVYNDGKNMTVNEVVGYNNSMKVEDNLVAGTDKNTIHAAYVAATTTDKYFTDGANPGASAGNSYPVADVVVIEINTPLAGIMETALLYSINTRTSGDVKSLDAIQGSTPKTYNVDTTWENHYADLNPFTFQKLSMRDGKVVDNTPIIGNFADNNIFAGQINATNGVLTDDDGRYVVLTNGETVQIDPKVPVYTFSARNKNTYDIDDSNALTTRNNGDKIIYVTNNNGVVQYVINVSKSTDGPNVITALNTLYNSIVLDSTKYAVNFVFDPVDTGVIRDKDGDRKLNTTQSIASGRDLSFTVQANANYAVTSVTYTTYAEDGTTPVLSNQVMTPVNGVYTLADVDAKTTITVHMGVAESPTEAAADLITAAGGDGSTWTMEQALQAAELIETLTDLEDPKTQVSDLEDLVGEYMTAAETAADQVVTDLMATIAGSSAEITAAKNAMDTAIDNAVAAGVVALSAIFDGTNLKGEKWDALKALVDAQKEIEDGAAAEELAQARTDAETAIDAAVTKANTLKADSIAEADVTAAKEAVNAEALTTKAEVEGERDDQLEAIYSKALKAYVDGLTLTTEIGSQGGGDALANDLSDKVVAATEAVADAEGVAVTATKDADNNAGGDKYTLEFTFETGTYSKGITITLGT